MWSLEIDMVQLEILSLKNKISYLNIDSFHGINYLALASFGFKFLKLK